MKLRNLIAASTVVALGIGFAPSANAADTVVTFTVSGGGVALEVVAADGNLSDPTAGPTGATSSGTIASVKVTDSSADLTGWTATAAMTGPFTSTADLGAAGAANDTISCDTATVTSGVATASAGTVTFVPVAVNTALALDGSTADDADDCAPKAIGSATVAVGANSVTFPTSISIAIPSTALAGTYQGTIVQTAA